jgi:CspA family cold shock protein
MSTNNVSTSSERFTGRVKWFNNKAGYGFITVTDGSKSGTDIFVHHSSIKVDDEQYKYLVQGEYVNFNLLDTVTDSHEYQAGDVCGIKGGKLMCETRHESRVARYQYKSTKTEDEEPAVKMPRQVSAPRDNSRPKSQHSEKEWTPVSRTRDIGSGSGPGPGSTSRGSKGSTGRGSGTGGRGTTSRGSGTGGKGGSTGRGRGRPPKLEREQSTAGP